MIPKRVSPKKIIGRPLKSSDERDINECYETLAMAVVAQAARDHCKSFFYGPVFGMYCPHIDGPALWKQIEQNYQEIGKWKRCDENFGNEVIGQTKKERKRNGTDVQVRYF